ncbi:hypothetical protein CGCTS75_v013440 [Colletotrichum tropicale]|nr:hypothetical protein CGCTS75_v013440 [Colletotrichum tropicale]
MDRSNKSPPPPLPVNPSWAQADYYTESKTWCGPAQTSPGEKARPDTGPGVGSLSPPVLPLSRSYTDTELNLRLFLFVSRRGKTRLDPSLSLSSSTTTTRSAFSSHSHSNRPHPSPSQAPDSLLPPTVDAALDSWTRLRNPGNERGLLVGAAVAVGLSIGSLPPSAPTSS